MPSVINDAQRRFLRSQGHALRPVVTAGAAGMSDAVIAEAEQALVAHELIKVRLRISAPDARTEALERLLDTTGAALVQKIGHVALIYRAHPRRPRIILPSG